MRRKEPTVADLISRVKKAGGKRREAATGTKVMASPFDTYGIKANEREKYRDAFSLKSMDEAAAFIGTFAQQEKDEDQLWSSEGRARAMQFGAVWAGGVAVGGFIKAAVDKGETTEFDAAKQLFHVHVQTARLWMRVFKRRDDLPEAVSLYEQYKEAIPFEPRKKNGIDYDRDCLRLLDKARTLARKATGIKDAEPRDEDVLEAGTALVPAAKPPSTAPTPAEQTLRWMTITAYCLAVLKQKNVGILPSLAGFENIEEVARAIRSTTFDGEKEPNLLDGVQGVSFAAMNIGTIEDDAEAVAERLLEHEAEVVEDEEPQAKRKSGNGRRKVPSGNGRRKRQAVPAEPAEPTEPAEPPVEPTDGTEPTE